MSSARDDILQRIRSSLDEALLPDAVPDPPAYNVSRTSSGIDAFIREAEALSSQVLRVDSAQTARERLLALCQERGWQQALTWVDDEMPIAGLIGALNAVGIETHHAGDPNILELLPVGITGTEAALADTGTIVVIHGAGRSPLASLLPPVHVALVDASRVHADMATYWQSITGGAAEHVADTSNLVFISGPSRTGDIEQTLTLGVHGPRELILIVYG